jgi:hypothetical protein
MSGGGECGYKFVLTPVSALDIKKMFDVREARIPLFPSFFFESDFYTLFRPSFFSKNKKKSSSALRASSFSPLTRARAPRFYVYLFIHLFIKE